MTRGINEGNEKTHEESQNHQKQLEEKNQSLQNEVVKLQENQRKLIEKSEEIQSKNEKLTGDLKEKEQQLSIIYKESEERQKVYQNTISLFNDKNQAIQHLNNQIEQLKNEVSTSLAARNQLQAQFDQFKLDAQVLTGSFFIYQASSLHFPFFVIQFTT